MSICDRCAAISESRERTLKKKLKVAKRAHHRVQKLAAKLAADLKHVLEDDDQTISCTNEEIERALKWAKRN